MFFLIICTLLGVLYLVYKTSSLSRSQAALAAILEAEPQKVEAPQQVHDALAYGWFDEGWPTWKTVEEQRAPLENPTLGQALDDYVTQMFIAEYRSTPNPRDRKEFLRRLVREGVSTKPELLDLVYADESPFVRAWAAAHLATDCHDYADWQPPRDITEYKEPPKIRDFEPALLQDREPIVRAALWSNPQCTRLPWSDLRVRDGWKEQTRRMSHIERLGLMRNPKLSKDYVVALLDTPSNELGITRKEHCELLVAAAVNPEVVGGSRETGRECWVVFDACDPFPQYGRMWELCLEKWLDRGLVANYFFKYVQTTPEVKLAAYSRLLEEREGSDRRLLGVLRRHVIRSCDPFDDEAIIKVAWNDPDEDCRKAAQERVGRFAGHGRFAGYVVAKGESED